MVTVRGLDRRPLALPAFRRLWIASAVSAIGGSFSVIAVPAQLFALTGSSAAIGWSAAVTFPLLACGALGTGALADVLDRRRLLLGAHTSLALTYLLLWAQSVAELRSVAVLLVLAGGQGLSYGAILTTTGAALPRVVPPNLLAAANSLSSLTRYTGAVVGPLLAGVLIPVTGLGTLYLLDAAALITVLWAAFRLPALPTRTGPPPIIERRRLAGFRLLATDLVLRAVLGLDLVAMVFGMPSALFPELAAGDLAGPAAGRAIDRSQVLGLLYAAYPAGVFALGLISGTFTRTRRPGALITLAALIWGMTVIIAGLTANLWLTLAALGLGGAANFVLSTCRNAITQAVPDDSVRGRTQGALTIVLIGGPQAGAAVHGLVGSLLGARHTICLGGLLTLAAAALLRVAAPQLWRYRSAAGPQPPDQARPEADPGVAEARRPGSATTPRCP